MTALAGPFCGPSGSGGGACGYRITDNDNSPAADATVSDQQFAVPVDCQPSNPAKPYTASDCGFNTTANALKPGLVKSGKAAVIEIGEVQFLDGGVDGVPGNEDDRVFAVQGIFAP